MSHMWSVGTGKECFILEQQFQIRFYVSADVSNRGCVALNQNVAVFQFLSI